MFGEDDVEIEHEAVDVEAVVGEDDADDGERDFGAVGVEGVDSDEEGGLGGLLGCVHFLPFDGDIAVALSAVESVGDFDEAFLFDFEVGLLTAFAAGVGEDDDAEGDDTAEEEEGEDEADEGGHGAPRGGEWVWGLSA